jgi:hypothetical protein
LSRRTLTRFAFASYAVNSAEKLFVLSEFRNNRGSALITVDTPKINTEASNIVRITGQSMPAITHYCKV